MRVFVLSLTLAFASLTQAALPAHWSQVYFFGDALTDMGNYVPTRRVPCFDEPAPQVNTTAGKQAGKTWAELFASQYGLHADPSTQGGTNFATVGAMAEDMATKQVKAYLSTVGGQADPGALYVIWGGSQDLFTKVIEEKRAPAQVLIDGVEETLEAAEALAKHGARHILVIGLHDVSLTPFLLLTDAEAQGKAHEFISKWNLLMFKALPYMKSAYPATHFYGWNPEVMMREAHQQPSQYGFPNRVNDAMNGDVANDSTWWCPFNMGSNVDTFMFFGALQPSSSYHEQIAHKLKNEAAEL